MKSLDCEQSLILAATTNLTQSLAKQEHLGRFILYSILGVYLDEKNMLLTNFILIYLLWLL